VSAGQSYAPGTAGEGDSIAEIVYSKEEAVRRAGTEQQAAKNSAYVRQELKKIHCQEQTPAAFHSFRRLRD
jgi:hypothetical protein